MNSEQAKILGMLIAAFCIGDYARCLELLKIAKDLNSQRRQDVSVMYPVQTCLTAQELKDLDAACTKISLSRYEFLKQALKEKIEHVRRNSQKS